MVGNAANVVPEQIAATCANVGIICGFIEMFTVAILLSDNPSFALYVKLSVVLIDPSCVYWKVPLTFREIEPWFGGVTNIAESESPSASVSLERTLLILPNKLLELQPTKVFIVSFWAIGAVLMTIVSTTRIVPIFNGFV